MITFQTEVGRFTYRVAGIAIQDGRVLIHKDPDDDFWVLPGGRAEMMEQAHETLRREMLEETGFEVSVGRLVWIVENFFVYQGIPFHELGLYFEMSVGSSASVHEASSFLGKEGEKSLQFRWATLHDLRNLRVQPAFLMDRLAGLPATTERVVHVDPSFSRH